jgi:GMP synthase-like glutamine amidotransferase
MTVIGILECGRNKSEWLRDHGGFADWFPPLLLPVNPALRFAVWRADLGELPDAPDACDAWLLTGSPVSTYQDLPWQQALTDFVVEARNHRPLVGICYGHQHLHAALGGHVEKAPQWGAGIRPYDIVRQPDWASDEHATPVADKLRLVALHQDHVTRPAPGTQVLASSPNCPFAVTLIGANVLTFQPHPEMTPAQAAKIYDLHRNDLGDALWARARTSLDTPRDARLAACWIVDFVKSHSGASGTPAASGDHP